MASNFKILRIIGDTNMIVTKMDSMIACRKEYLSRCKDMLQLAFKDTHVDFQGSPLQMIPQVHNQTTNSMRKKFSTQRYDGGSVYQSLMQTWIDKACESNHSPWQEFQGFQAPKFSHHYISILAKILLCTQLILYDILSWIISKDKGQGLGMNDMIRWLRWWYDFT